MEKEIHYTSNVAETEKIGAFLAEKLINSFSGKYFFVALYGDLGAGKTAFTRGFASVISPGSKVKSPTYTIVNEYRKGKVPLFHFDLYRLEESEELYTIGFDDYQKTGHCIVEWSEYLGDGTPDEFIKVNITKENDDSRKIEITYNCIFS